MFDRLSIFQTATEAARHAGRRQVLAAQNVAQADTPGYRARDLQAFSSAMDKGGPRLVPRSTRAGHLPPAEATPARFRPQMLLAGGTMSPNGNDVSLETEVLRAAEIERDHNRALAIYRHGMTVLRSALGRR